MSNEKNEVEAFYKEMWRSTPLIIRMVWVGSLVGVMGFAGTLLWAVISVVLHITK